MPLLFLLLAALALASDSRLPAATDARGGTKVAPSELELPEISSNHDSKKKSVQSRMAADDEERLAGKNMFNPDKVLMALQDKHYADELFLRWRRHKKTFDDVSNGIKNMKLDETAKTNLLKKFEENLKASDDASNVLKTVELDEAVKPNLVTTFDENLKKNKELAITNEMLTKALQDSNFAVRFFKKLWLHDITSTTLLWTKHLDSEKALGVHSKYLNWLQLHHPGEGKSSILSAEQFLFEKSRAERAIADSEFAAKLFTKWEQAGFDKDRAFAQMKNTGLGDDATHKLRVRYAEWRGEPPPPPPPRKSWLRRILRFFQRLFRFRRKKE